MPGEPREDSKYFGRFPEALEREFRAAIFDADRKTNFYALLIALPLYALYALLDAFSLTAAETGVITRICATLLAAIPLILMKRNLFSRSHDVLTAIAIIILGAGLNFIILQEPTFDDNYYVALIQGGIFVSFLVRLTFTQSTIVLATFLAGFVVSVADKSPRQEALLQIFILITMFSMCAFGIHLTQKMRRREFLQSKTIARQNEKLNMMLESVQLDNARKVAAMNLLVHFVKTPVHQIVGFTDVIGRALSEQGAQTSDDCAKSVDFIKTASRELSQNVNRLLAYYRLDDKADQKIELVELDHLIRDYAERIPSNIRVSTDCAKVAVNNHNAIICAALSAIVERYSDDGAEVSTVEISLKRSGDKAVITVHDDGQAISTDEFQNMARPLDKIDRYLTANGSSMPMMIRTIARAAQLCGGELTHSSATGQNIFALTLLDMKTEPAEAEAAA